MFSASSSRPECASTRGIFMSIQNSTPLRPKPNNGGGGPRRAPLLEYAMPLITDACRRLVDEPDPIRPDISPAVKLPATRARRRSITPIVIGEGQKTALGAIVALCTFHRASADFCSNIICTSPMEGKFTSVSAVFCIPSSLNREESAGLLKRPALYSLVRKRCPQNSRNILGPEGRNDNRRCCCQAANAACANSRVNVHA